MSMLIYFLWFSTLALRGLVIGVSLVRGFYGKYLGFYLYLTFALTISLLRLFVYAAEPENYLALYWWTEFLIVAAGFGVTWEIFSHALKHYAGVIKMARVLVSSFFALLLFQALHGSVTGQMREFARSVMRLERNMRAVETLLLAVLVLLIMYYGVPLGRNLLGLIWGYGLYVTTSVIMLTLRTALGPSSQAWLDPLRQTIEIVVALIWLAALWRYEPGPEAEAKQGLAEDYSALAARTSQAIGSARAQLIRMFTS
jgi:hypothetical protein